MGASNPKGQAMATTSRTAVLKIVLFDGRSPSIGEHYRYSWAPCLGYKSPGITRTYIEAESDHEKKRAPCRAGPKTKAVRSKSQAHECV
jgi:hypothetical protein